MDQAAILVALNLARELRTLHGELAAGTAQQKENPKDAPANPAALQALQRKLDAALRQYDH